MIVLERFYTPKGTWGEMELPNGEVFSTIELPWKDNKPFESCIPEGLYTCVPYSSEKYPGVFEITDVPEREYVLFHVANYPDDVQGCIGVGKNMLIHSNQLMVTHSGESFDKFKEAIGDKESFDVLITGFQAEYP